MVKEMKKATILIMLFPLLGFVSQAAPRQEGQFVVKVVVDMANVRLTPSLQGQVIGQLQTGTLLEAQEKSGEWYLVNLPPDEQGYVVSGYIHQSMVQVISTIDRAQPAATPKPVETPAQPQPPARETAAYETARTERWSPPAEKIFSGVFLKFGWLRSPDPGSFSNAWLASIGFDLGLGRNVGLGLEIQPATRSYSELDLAIIPVMAFGNLKAGLNLGQFLSFLRFLNLYGGVGAGVEVSYTKTTYEDETFMDFKSMFAHHLFFGTEIDLGSIRLIADYQLAKVSDPSVDPDSYRHYLLFGIRF